MIINQIVYSFLNSFDTQISWPDFFLFRFLYFRANTACCIIVWPITTKSQTKRVTSTSIDVIDVSVGSRAESHRTRLQKSADFPSEQFSWHDDHVRLCNRIREKCVNCITYCSSNQRVVFRERSKFSDQAMYWCDSDDADTFYVTRWLISLLLIHRSTSALGM